MAGGIWTSQNKVLPGVYINVKSQPNVTANVGDKGVVAIAKALSWGALGAVQEITPGQDLTPFIGYDIGTEQAQFLREMMRGTDVTACPKKILLYRCAGTGGVKASATIGTLTITALYEGVRGNDITVGITADPDDEDAPGRHYYVNTYVEGRVVDTQYVTSNSALVANAWVEFSGSGNITANAGTALTGGVDPEISVDDYSAFLTAIEPYTFDIIAYDGSTMTVVNAFVAFVKRMNENIGRKCQLVIGNYSALNSEYVICVRNGVVLADGSTLDDKQAVWWVAGAEAGAQYYQSLTYTQYPTAISANPKLTDDEAESAITSGRLAFVDDFGVVKICSDINNLTTVTPTKGAEFKKNRVMRVIMQFCNDVYEHFSLYFIGKVDNNESGRALLRAWVIGYLNEMQGNNGIQNFAAEDVEVLPGNEIDSVLVNVALQPVDSIEKVYMLVTVSVNGVTVE